MKLKFFKISSIILALLVLISTFSLTIEKHFCGDFLVDIAYFGKTQGCDDEEDEDCDKPSVIEKENCCKDETEQLKGQEELTSSSKKKITFKKQQFLLAFVLSYNNLFKNLQKQVVPHKSYSPPKLVYDIQLLQEVFII